MNAAPALCGMLLHLPISGKQQHFSPCHRPSVSSRRNHRSSLPLTRSVATETAAQREVPSGVALTGSGEAAEAVEEEAPTEIEIGPVVPRRLVLLRHAKSSLADRSLRDHDRPLSKAGRAEAIKVARKLEELGWIPEIILLSDAARTRETLRIMQEQVTSFLEAEVHFFSSFYSIAAMDGQTADHLQKAICKHSRDEIVTVMCMGHNRGWEEAASMFAGASIELKTCNAALLEASGRSWDEAFALAGLGGWKLHGIVKPAA